MPVDPTAEDPRDRVTKRRAMVSCCVRSCFRASFSFFHVFFSLFFCPLITCSRYVRGEVGYSVHMQRGNYLSAIIITKGPVGSIVAPTIWHSSTLFLFALVQSTLRVAFFPFISALSVSAKWGGALVVFEKLDFFGGGFQCLSLFIAPEFQRTCSTGIS